MDINMSASIFPHPKCIPSQESPDRSLLSYVCQNSEFTEARERDSGLQVTIVPKLVHQSWYLCHNDGKCWCWQGLSPFSSCFLSSLFLSSFTHLFLYQPLLSCYISFSFSLSMCIWLCMLRKGSWPHHVLPHPIQSSLRGLTMLLYLLVEETMTLGQNLRSC